MQGVIRGDAKFLIRITSLAALVIFGLSLGHDGRARAQAGGAYLPVATWETASSGLPGGIWRAPAGVAVLPTGPVITADAELRRIEVLDAAGTALRSFGGGGAPEDLVRPGHVAVDAARDRVYVVDPGAGRVAVYGLDGTAVGLWSGFGGPAGIAVAPDGRVVVADTDGDRIRVFAPDGSELGGWGGTGTGPTQMDFPAGVDVTSDGIVWVADRGNGRIAAVHLDGRSERSIRLNAAPLAGAEPWDVAVDPVAGELWVATSAGLARLDLKSGDLRGFITDAVTAAVAVDPAQGLFAAVTAADGLPGIWQYAYRQASGEPKARWGGQAMIPGDFDGLEALSIGDDGRAYLLDVPPRVQRLALSGQAEAQIAAPDPVEVDADATGQVYAVAGDTLYAYAPDGTERWQARLRAAGPSVDAALGGVGWDAVHGRVVVLDAGARQLATFDVAGAPAGDWSLRAAEASRASWTDLAIGPDGTWYTLDAGNQQVRGWDAFGRLAVEIPSPLAIRFDVAPDGSLVTLGTDAWLRRIARDGTVLATWDATRIDRGGHSRPADVAVDAAGRVYVADGGLNLVTVHALDPAAVAPPGPPQVDKGCEVQGDKRAAPGEIALGEAVEVTLLLRGACAAAQAEADVALVLDSALDRGQFKDARKAVERFIEQIDPSRDQAAVQPGGMGTGKLSNDRQRLRRDLRRIENTTGFNLAAAIQASEAELFGQRGRTGVKKVIIVLHGTELEDFQRWAIDRAAGQAKRRGAEIFTIAFGRKADLRTLGDIATDADHFVRARGGWDLAALYDRVAAKIKPTFLLGSLIVTDVIPENMAYVEGSAAPPATLQGRSLIWRSSEIPLAGIGFRFSLRPKEPGEWPTNVEARAEYTDFAGQTGSLTFPVPRVRVLAPPEPTPTPILTLPPTATPTRPPSPTATPTASPTASPAPSATPTPGRVVAYLPISLGEPCEVASIDVVLVIDASNSMAVPASPGRTKLDAAREAARAFLDLFVVSPGNQAAVVSFNNTALLIQPLTRVRADLDAALSAIQLASETRLDLGVVAAHSELGGPRHVSGGDKVMIVLTDGRANPVPVEVALDAARQAKADGVTIFTIGLGEDLDFAALEAMASQPRYFYRAPTAEALAGIYRDIAGEIPCPGGERWPG